MRLHGQLQRRSVLQLLGSGLAGSLVASGFSAVSAQGRPQVKIGYQRFTDLDIIRGRGELDTLVQSKGGTTEWIFFQSGPPMLEALNAGAVNFGGVGDTPPVFAQAAGTQFYYVAKTPRGPLTQDIVVPKDSKIQSPADLKGKKVALQRGSSAHYLLIQVLQENNISPKDVEVVSLSPSDARAAFEQGNVDAWSIWDPFLAVVESTGIARNLKVGRERNTFFLASRSFAETQPGLLQAILTAAKENEQWSSQNTLALAKKFAPELNIAVEVLAKANDRRQWGLFPITPAVIETQQKVADTLFKAEIIPQQIVVREATLPPEKYAQVFPA
ncbi:MAG: sulfonate ABC transporter substrate-binding protein [Synechococcales cyanobacterium]